MAGISGSGSWVLLQSRNEYYISPAQLQSPPPSTSSSSSSPSSFRSQYTTLADRISPCVLLIIVILAVIFFLLGLLHLLIRYLLRPTPRVDTEETDNVTALQGRLQQLFHLHDAGVDQSFIDTLPVFLYKAIVGVKDPFDCAVCLCEFESNDKLRLLPKCSHAFHIECIDTWLLSHSTCPLCRGSLVPEFSPANCCSPVVVLAETGSESSREIVADHVEENFLASFAQEEEILQKTGEEVMPETTTEKKVVSVKLGKFRNLDFGNEGEGSSCGNNNNGNLGGRRCFSMGSFEYVMDEKSLLQVEIRPPEKNPGGNKPRRRLAMSECDCHSQREGLKWFDAGRLERKESFSVSKEKIMQRENDADGPRGEFSFPTQQDGKKDKLGSSRRTESSEFYSGSEFDMDVEVGICNNGRVLSRREEMPSFARRTLLWVIGRNHRVVSHI